MHPSALSNYISSVLNTVNIEVLQGPNSGDSTAPGGAFHPTRCERWQGVEHEVRAKACSLVDCCLVCGPKSCLWPDFLHVSARHSHGPEWKRNRWSHGCSDQP